MKKNSQKYKGQKITLFFDENIPQKDVELLKKSHFSRIINFVSIFETTMVGISDSEIFKFCSQKDYILVTKDQDFINQEKFPLNKTSGLIILNKSNNSASFELENCLRIIHGLLLPNFFFQECKLKVSRNFISIEKNHVETNKRIKTCISLVKNQDLNVIYKIIEKKFDYPANKDGWEII